MQRGCLFVRKSECPRDLDNVRLVGIAAGEIDVRHVPNDSSVLRREVAMRPGKIAPITARTSDRSSGYGQDRPTLMNPISVYSLPHHQLSLLF